MNTIMKFQELLKELFQFDATDLDFGIYRILNYKRTQIKNFIHNDLTMIVEEAFAKFRDERLENIGQLAEEAKHKVTTALGARAFLPTGDLKEEFKETPVGKDYLAIRARKDEAAAIEEIKLQVFNDLYNFFSRYYDEGDFVPQFRYSVKNHKYAIPYNGEEVKLYWANSDQYYTKTGILFRDYAFFTDPAKSYKVIFRTVTAKEELGSNKATKARFFVLDDEEPFELADKNILIIRFQYRELTKAEVKKYEAGGGSNTSKQDKINQNTCETVLKGLEYPNLKISLGSVYNNDKPLLLYQITRFTAKNSRDFFIHKNLKAFLSEQLDYFIKADVISIETLERERFLDKHITRAKVVREIGGKIIDFLAQIEDFQKKLWEKKKFVLKTGYVVTTDRIPEEFHEEILKNKEQVKEWKSLGLDVAKSKKNLKDKKLPVDTQYFATGFKERLLERLTENAGLDDLLDGLLIKSENWQGLNALLPKFREEVKCIYIDPPYNTGNDEFIYRDRYKHSSWLTMIDNRLNLSKYLLTLEGFVFCSIDENEIDNLAKALDLTFPQRVGIAIIQTNPKGRGQDKYLSTSHDYLLAVAKSEKANLFGLPKNETQLLEYHLEDNIGKYRLLELRNTHRQFHRGNRPNLWYPLFVSPQNGKVDYIKRDKSIKVLPIWNDGFEGCWTWGKELVEKNLHLLIGREVAGRYKIYRKDYAEQLGIKAKYTPKTIWNEPEMRTDYAQQLLDNLFGQRIFQSPKPPALISRAIHLTTGHSDKILDFFSGSGTTAHAVMALNHEDRSNRKFILIEMADYFDTVIIPRVKKVAYSFNWKDGKPQDAKGIGVFFKYQALEQYEDALDNIELKENQGALELFGSDYLLKYFLDFESREDTTLVNFDQFKQPFSYKLKVNFEEVGEPKEVMVDLPETFHYLLGLKVRKMKSRKNKGKKYLFTLGEKEGREVAAVWREYDDDWTETDFKRDKEFIIREIATWAPQIIYVNGQSILTPQIGKHTAEIRAIEPEFKKRMVNA